MNDINQLEVGRVELWPSWDRIVDYPPIINSVVLDGNTYINANIRDAQYTALMAKLDRILELLEDKSNE